MAGRLIPILVILALVAANLSAPGVAPSAAQQRAVGSTCPTPAGDSDSGVTVGLEAIANVNGIVSFGLPLPPGAVEDAATLAVTMAGEPVAATVTVLLDELDSTGEPVGVRSVLVQLPAECWTASAVRSRWPGRAEGSRSRTNRFRSARPAPPPTRRRTSPTTPSKRGPTGRIAGDDRIATRRSSSRRGSRQCWRPSLTGTWRPPASSVPRWPLGEVGDDLAGLRFMSDAVTPFGLSAMFQESYPLNAAMVIDPTDPEDGYEGWLYDRCATFLSFACTPATCGSCARVIASAPITPITSN